MDSSGGLNKAGSYRKCTLRAAGIPVGFTRPSFAFWILVSLSLASWAFLAAPQPILGQSGSHGMVDSVGGAGNGGRRVSLGSSDLTSHSSPTPYVASTLVLFNGTTVPGNFVPGDGLVPVALSYDPTARETFTVDIYTSNISAVNDSTGLVAWTLPVGYDPLSDVYDGQDGRLFVADSSNVTVVSPDTKSVIGNISVGSAPTPAIGFDSHADVLAVGTTGDDLALVNASTSVLSHLVTLGAYPLALVCDYGLQETFVSVGNDSHSWVSVVSDVSGQILANLTTSAPVVGLAYDGADRQILLADGSSNNVSVLSDTSYSVIRNISIGEGANGVAYDAIDGEIWVVTSTDSLLVVSNTTGQVLHNITTASPIVALTWVTGSTFLQALSDLGALDTFSAAAGDLVGTAQLSSQPYGLAYDPFQNLYLVTENAMTNSGVQANGTVLLVNASTGAAVGDIPVGIDPYRVSFDPAREEGFSAGSDFVTAFSLKNDSTLSNVTIGTGAGLVAYDPNRGEIFAAAASDNVTVINDTNFSVSRVLNVGGTPGSFAYDAQAGLMLVSTGSGSILAINDTTDIVSTVVNLTTPATNMVFDSGTNQLLFDTNIGFAPAQGYVSAVNLSTGAVSTPTRIGDASAGLAFDPITGDVYVANSYAGPTGNSTGTVSVVSVANGSVISTIHVGSRPVGLVWDSSHGTMVVSNKFQGTLSAINAGPPAPTRSVDFHEAGLPVSTQWSIELGGVVRSSSDELIQFAEPNGSYPYFVGPEPGYSANPSAGTIRVDGTNVSIEIAFNLTVEPVYRVLVQESGLPTGTHWSVLLQGVENSSTSSTVGFWAKNGTYALQLLDVPNYGSTYPTEINVYGSPLTVGVQFKVLDYAVAFSESGLPIGSQWTVVATNSTSLQSYRENSTGPDLTLSLPNGTYNVSAIGPAGYGAKVASPTVHISGLSPITFQVSYYSTGVTGAPSPYETYGILAILALVAFFGSVGAVAGARRIRYARHRKEAEGWFRRFREDSAEPKRPPERG